jgi:molybdate transport system ATP-binding protein
MRWMSGAAGYNLVLLEQGRVVASGALGETLARLDLPIAHFDDAGTVIEAEVARHDEAYHLTQLDFPGGHLWVGKVDQPFGTSVRARVLARDVSIAMQVPEGSSINNILAREGTRADKVLVRMRSASRRCHASLAVRAIISAWLRRRVRALKSVALMARAIA